MRSAALSCVLAKKFKERELKFISAFPRDLKKTRELARALGSFGARSFLLVLAKGNTDFRRAARNIPRVKTTDPRSMNVEDALKHKEILLEQGTLETFASKKIS